MFNITFRLLLRTITVAVILFGGSAFSASAYAAQKLCDDGSRPPCETGGGEGDGGAEPPDLGDLIILYRDANGVPILDGNQCQQPIAFTSDTCTLDCTGLDPCLVPVDPETCAVQAGFESCTQEVDFGRMNSARAPASVFESQLADVIVNLATADCITLDPAGRLVTSRVSDGIVTSGEIDSPLQNLAIYRQLMLKGFLGDAADPITLPASALDTTARALGAAADKTGEVNVDLVVYLNRIMGLTDQAVTTILDPKLCIDVKEEVMGVVQTVEKCFLDYSGHGYQRRGNFEALPAPRYIPADEPKDGWFEYLAEISPQQLPPLPPLFQIMQGPVLDPVFPDGQGGVDPGFMGGNIGGFAQQADDARAVINYMHNWPIPGDFATAMTCASSGNTSYDVSLSEESGLKVPVQMVDGGDGRDFTVAVNNASTSPNAATGIVTVTAAAENGGIIEGSPWVFAFNDIAPGASQAWIQFFSINLGEPTTINWTATAIAPDDVYATNNSVTATTSVRVTSGGGSGGGRRGGH